MSPATGMRERARRALLAAAVPEGHWEGELSSSALSTATAACALALHERAGAAHEDAPGGATVARAFAWIGRHQNADGGFGDTASSPSNASTTLLCWAALGVDAARAAPHRLTEQRAEAWLRGHVGALTPSRLARSVVEAYGDDRTFSIPILTMCALAGRFGSGLEAWRPVQAIPFELAALPQRWFERVGLPMVSYALPALIAVGQVGHHHRPTWNPLLRVLRDALRRRTLAVLERIQPAGGGFLEAAPLTSFVVMSLVGCGLADHPVAARGVSFLIRTQRRDGSWPIDTNLATWLTSSAVQALAGGGHLEQRLDATTRARLVRWLLDQQYLSAHPYTHAAPGGWAWTDLSGGVPDADDTAGALLALRALAGAAGPVAALGERAALGAGWLLDLQNADGGVPTFCRGWTRLPFDRSSPDITAHALRAWSAWRPDLTPELGDRIGRASAAAIRYLVRQQRGDGVWVPLWFGNQHEPRLDNPVYGTARVLLASDVATPAATPDAWHAALARGRAWLVAAQNPDGGWGGGTPPSSVEETALALEALAGHPDVEPALARGVAWLEQATSGGTRFEQAPIGLYFARLWYSERLYPIIFCVAALERLAAAARAGAPALPGMPVGEAHG